MFKSLEKNMLSFTLALMMVLSIFAMPAQVLAEEYKESWYSELEERSYVAAVLNDQTIDKKYSTSYVVGDPENVGNGYNDVVRGRVFLVYPNTSNVELTQATVTLKAQNGESFTLNGQTVANNTTGTFTLDLTKENKIVVNHAETLGTNEQWEYTIAGAKADDTVNVITFVSVANPRDWVAGTYNQPGYPVEPVTGHKDEVKVKDALKGFDELETRVIPVSKGTSAMEVLGKYGALSNMNITGMENNYVSYMGAGGHSQIGEFDINNYSGWMYTINEGQGWYFPNVGAGSKSLTQDTTMIWHFTMAYGQDIGAPWGAPDGSTGMPLSNTLADSLLSQERNPIPVLQWKDAPRFSNIEAK